MVCNMDNLLNFCINKIEEKLFSIIQNQKLRNDMKRFFQFLLKRNLFADVTLKLYTNEIIHHIDTFSVIDHPTWDNLCRQVQLTKAKRVTFLIELYYFFLTENYDLGPYTGYLKENDWLFLGLQGLNIKKIFSPGTDPRGFLDMIFANSKSKQLRTRIYINAPNQGTRELLKKFAYTLSMGQINRPCYRRFFAEFKLSISENIPKDIYGFNQYTFVEQFEYYNQFNASSDHNHTFTLSQFYVFLFELIEREGIHHVLFSAHSGLSKSYIMKKNFLFLFGTGFKLVHYSRFDNVPTHDKWLLNPGIEATLTTAIKSVDLITLDFSQIPDCPIKTVFKSWFWNSELTFYNRYSLFKSLKIIIEYFCRRRKTMQSMVDGSLEPLLVCEITLLSVVQFRAHLINYANLTTRNKYVTALKCFCDYIWKTNAMPVDFSAFDYLKLFPKKIYEGETIPDSELQMITQFFKDRAQNGKVKDKLCWILLALYLTSNIRPSEALDMTRDCKEEAMKEGEYCLKLKRKGSFGDKEDYSVNAYVVNLIEMAISITDQYFYHASPEIRDYIFIYESRGRILPITRDTIYRRLHAATRRLDIGPYSLSNVRDTFMTRAIDESVRQGKTMEEISVITNHKDYNTDRRHYYQLDVRKILEATYHITIGNIIIPGQVVKSLDAFDKTTIVKKGCGNCEISDKCIMFFAREKSPLLQNFFPSMRVGNFIHSDA